MTLPVVEGCEWLTEGGKDCPCDPCQCRPNADYVARHCCPDHCVDDLCVHSDIGLCGHERCSLFEDDEDYDAPCEWVEAEDYEPSHNGRSGTQIDRSVRS